MTVGRWSAFEDQLGAKGRHWRRRGTLSRLMKSLIRCMTEHLQAPVTTNHYEGRRQEGRKTRSEWCTKMMVRDKERGPGSVCRRIGKQDARTDTDTKIKTENERSMCIDISHMKRRGRDMILKSQSKITCGSRHTKEKEG